MKFMIGYGSCGIAAGAEEVARSVTERLKDSTCTVDLVGCNGMCFAEPLMQVTDDEGNDYYYGRLTGDEAVKVVDAFLNGGMPPKTA